LENSRDKLQEYVMENGGFHLKKFKVTLSWSWQCHGQTNDIILCHSRNHNKTFVWKIFL